MASLVAGTTTIVFVPLLLQELHGLPPLAAGYLTVVEALGWTGAALATSAAGPKGARRAIAAGPAVMLAGLLGLAWSMPGGGGHAPIALWLALVGAGVGMGWAHLASHALAVAPEGPSQARPPGRAGQPVVPSPSPGGPSAPSCRRSAKLSATLRPSSRWTFGKPTTWTWALASSTK
jgi:hypothetical protein